MTQFPATGLVRSYMRSSCHVLDMDMELTCAQTKEMAELRLNITEKNCLSTSVPNTTETPRCGEAFCF